LAAGDAELRLLNRAFEENLLLHHGNGRRIDPNLEGGELPPLRELPGVVS